MGPPRSTRTDDALVAVALALLAYALAAGSWVWRTDRLVYDAAMRLWPRDAPADIVLVAIDDASVGAIGRWPWRRAVHATLLERLADARPRAIVLDLVLSEPDPDPRQDALLAGAIERARPVVMPVTWQAVPGEVLRTLEPVAALRRHATLGAAEVAVDADGVLRHAFLEAGPAGRMLPNLAVAVLRAGGEAVHAQLAVDRAGDDEADDAWRRRGRFPVRYGGPPGQVRRVSYVDVLRGAVPAAELNGRYLLVGMTAQGLGDTLATPVNAGQRAMPGVEALANMMETLRRGDAPRALSPRVAGALSGAAVLLLVGTFGLAGTRVALGVALASLPLALAASLWAQGQGWWWSPAPFMVAAVLAYPLWSWRRLERGVARLDAEIERLASEPGVLAAPAVASARSGGDRLDQRLAVLHTAAETVRTAHRLLADALAGMPMAMLVDDGHGAVLLANPLAAQLFDEPSADDLKGLDVARLLGEFECQPRPDWVDVLARVRRTCEDHAVQAHVPGHGDHVVHATAAAMHGATRLIVTVADVTPVKQAQRAREELLAFVTHDLRAPAISIALLAELQLQGRSPLQAEALMHEMHRLAGRTLSMADDFVRIAQAEQRPLQLDGVQPAALVADVLSDFAPQALAAGVALHSDVPDDLAAPPMDGELVRRAVGNLVANAIRHSPAGGQVRVAAAQASGPGVRFDVTDQGPGLEEAAMAQLRDAQDGLAPGHRRGSGLGLLFVQRVAARHRGRLEVRRASCGGAHFTLTIGRASGNA